MKATAHALATYLLDENEDDLARQFILGKDPAQVAAAERKATAEARTREFFANYDKKFSARRAMGEVTPDTDAHYFWHREKMYSDGRRALMVRRSGNTRRWVTRPDDFRIPVKYGMYQNGYIDQDTAYEWTTIEPPIKPLQKMLRGFK